MADTIGTAYVQIEPSFDGVTPAIEKQFGGEGKKAGGSFGKGFASVVGGSAKVIGGAVAVGSAAITAMGAKFISSAGDVAVYGDNIDKMSQKMGLTAEAYQEWDAVMQHSGTSMETMKASMKTLANAAESGNEAFEALGITQEELANMSQQDIFEATIAGLQNVEDTTTRTYLAGKLLGRGATELGALLNTSAEDTQAMRDRVKELGGVMSDDAVKAAAAYQDQLQDMQTAFGGLSREMMSEFLPNITIVMAGLTEIFSGNSEGGLGMITEGITNISTGLLDALPQLLEVGSSIVSALGQAIVTNLPILLSTGVSILENLSTGLLTAIPTMVPSIVSFIVEIGNMIIQNLPLLIEAGAQIIIGLATGIGQSLPELIPTIIEVIINIATYLLENIDVLIEAAGQLMIGLSMGLLNAIPVIVSKIPQIVLALANALISAGLKLTEVGQQYITTLANALMTYVPQLLAKAQQIVTDLKNKFMEKVKAFTDVGKNIVEGIKNGLADAWGSLTGWFDDKISGLVDGAKSLLGIHSPSTVFADEVGEHIPGGVAKGIKKGMGVLDNAIKGMTDGMLTTSIESTVVSDSIMSAEVGTNNTDALYKLLAQFLPVIASGDNVNVFLEGDANRLFRVVKAENKKNTEITGVNAFA